MPNTKLWLYKCLLSDQVFSFLPTSRWLNEDLAKEIDQFNKWVAEPESKVYTPNYFKIVNSLENNLEVTGVKEKLETICF